MSKLKQSFYENHSGSTIPEINHITAVILVGHALYNTLCLCDLVKSTTDQLSWGFTCYVFNILLAITVYSNKHGTLLALYALPSFALLLLAQYRPDSVHAQEAAGKDTKRKRLTAQSIGKHQVAFLSVYRATMMITTILAILAVDLPQFPRRYAKTETWGTSLMDLGVGSFVFSSGVVSFRQHQGVLDSLRSGGIILAMGVGRALMVRGTGYHEHVSEYGIHWNFFITLSLLPPLLPALRKVQKLGVPFLLQGVIVCVMYQMLLLVTGWQKWIVLAYRDTLLSANKEGVSSFAGYLSIFLLGLDAGAIILSKKVRPIITLLLFSSITFGFGYYFAQGYLKIRVSRRIANAPYIMWVAAHNSTFLLALRFVEEGFNMFSVRLRFNKQRPISIPLLLDRINSKGLYVFLGANLVTGAINLWMGDSMMFVKSPTGLAILILYGFFVCVGAIYI